MDILRAGNLVKEEYGFAQLQSWNAEDCDRFPFGVRYGHWGLFEGHSSDILMENDNRWKNPNWDESFFYSSLSLHTEPGT